MTEDDTVVRNLRRRSDNGFWCTLAIRFGQASDFVQNRHIDKQFLLYTVIGTALYAVYWSMEYVWEHPDQPGADVAMKLGAITLPLTWIIPKMVDSYFNATKEK